MVFCIHNIFGSSFWYRIFNIDIGIFRRINNRLDNNDPSVCFTRQLISELEEHLFDVFNPELTIYKRSQYKHVRVTIVLLEFIYFYNNISATGPAPNNTSIFLNV